MAGCRDQRNIGNRYISLDGREKGIGFISTIWVQYFGLYKSLVIPDLEHACSSDNPAITRMFMHPTHHSLILVCSFLTTQASPSPSIFLCNHRMCSICPYTLALISIQGLEELFQARGGSHMFPTVFVAFSAPGVASFTNVRPSVG